MFYCLSIFETNALIVLCELGKSKTKDDAKLNKVPSILLLPEFWLDLVFFCWFPFF